MTPQKTTAASEMRCTQPIHGTVIGQATLHQGNTLNILPTLSGQYDALITDPPYSSGGRTAAERQKSPSAKYQHGGTHHPYALEFEGELMDARSWTNWCRQWLEASRKLVKPGGYCLAFTDWRQLPSMTDAIQQAGWHWRGIAVWDKGLAARGPHKGYFKHQCEYIVWASNGSLPAAPHGGPWPGCYQHYLNPAEKLHMTAKPIALMRDLVQIIPPDGHILDPFMGSGTTGLACLETGRRFTGIEVTEHYYQIAEQRLRSASHS